MSNNLLDAAIDGKNFCSAAEKVSRCDMYVEIQHNSVMQSKSCYEHNMLFDIGKTVNVV